MFGTQWFILYVDDMCNVSDSVKEYLRFSSACVTDLL